jgi:pimeloyl-ACP methyl ester carboxylesterase
MRTRKAARLTLAVTLLAVVAGCAPTAQTWTFAPESSGATESAAPGASPSATTPASSSEPTADPSASAGAGTASYAFVRTEACPDESRFECITLAVPKDHRAAPGGPTWDVTFAIQRATGERKGTFVYIVGGPGGSGISVADSYTDYFDPAIAEAYDIVYVDQRGIGLSQPIQCIAAAATYYRDPNRLQVPAERPAAATAAERFATDCIAEAGIAEADLPLYATSQAIEDLEAIRDYLEADRLHLFGESYGTQFVQTYAAAHPDRIATLFVDGPVDLTIDGIDYYIESTRGAEDTLVAVLRSCTDDETCAANIEGGDALAAYDALAAQLATAPIEFDFPKADGTTERRSLSAADLENAAFGYLYSPADRASFLRGVAAASNGNYVPVMRMAYSSVGVDPETLVAEEDPSWSDAMYFAVECQDYAFLPDAGDADARLTAWLEAGAAAGIDDLRLGTSFYGDVPCLFWPGARTTADRPAPLVDVPYPVFVLTSTTDPATPIVNGYRIYSRLDDAWFFQTVGGPHIIYGWGEACPDTEIAAYLTDDELPPSRITTCDGSVTTTYVPTAAGSATDYDDALELMQSLDDQLLNTDDYLSWDGVEDLAVGCDFGGSLTYAATDVGTDVTLTACEFTDGMPLTGSASADDEVGTFELDMTSGGDDLQYERDADGNTSVSGTYEGEAVDLEEAA